MWNKISKVVSGEAFENISLLTLGKLFSYTGGFLYGVFGAYILGAEGFGQLVLIVAVVRLFSLFVNFRLGPPLLKLVKERLEGKGKHRNREYVVASALAQGIGVTVFGVVFLVFLVGGAPWFDLFADWQTALGLFALAEILYLQRKFVGQLVEAYEEFGWRATYEAVNSLFRDFLVIVFMYYGGVLGACLGFLVAELFIYLFLGLMAIKIWSRKVFKIILEEGWTLLPAAYEIYKNGRSHYVSGLIHKSYNEIAHLMIGGWVGTAGAAYYNIALKFKKFFAFPNIVLKTYLFPRFISKWARETHDEFYYTLRKFFYLTGPAFGILGVILVLLAPWLVPMLYSRDFVEAIPLVMLLVPAFALQKLFNIFTRMTFVIGQQRALLYEASIELFIGLPVAFVLIYNFGYLGAAWALTVKIACIVVYQIYFFYRNFGWRWIVPD